MITSCVVKVSFAILHYLPNEHAEGWMKDFPSKRIGILIYLVGKEKKKAGRRVKLSSCVSRYYLCYIIAKRSPLRNTV